MNGIELSASQVRSMQDCPRMYYYRWIRELCWPAPGDRDYRTAEAMTDQGSAFHAAIQRVALGILTLDQAIQLNTGEVARWLKRFKSTIRLPEEARIYSEIPLTMKRGDVVWSGKIDLLVLESGRATIYDWKTTRRVRSADRYAESPQTSLYRALVAANLDALMPERTDDPEIYMIYWFANDPENPLELRYDADQLDADLRDLDGYALEMRSDDETSYMKTADPKTCSWCRYRTYCRPVREEMDFDEEAFEPPAEEVSWDWVPGEEDSPVSPRLF